MVKRKNAFGGLSHLEIKACMPERFLNLCAGEGIEIVSAKRHDSFTLELLLSASQLNRAERLAAGKGFEITVRKKGRAWAGFLKRRIFPALLALCLVGLLFWSKFYVWEISISGNERINDGEILSALKACGVESGAFWPGFSADNIRSEVLAGIPELSWITVNMAGSHAHVLVVERKEKPDMVFEGGEASITAEKEGFVRRVQALEGQSAVKAGDMVSVGDVLISGVLQSSFAKPCFTRAQGSVIAETNSEYIAVAPKERAVRCYDGGVSRKYALIIGNNRINFYSDSSISDAFCDKIISVWNFEIPGMFKLPVSIVRENCRPYKTEVMELEQFEAGEALRQCLNSCLDGQIANGDVLSERLNYSEDKGLFIGGLRVRCLEEIGTLSPISDEEKFQAYSKYSEKADGG